jgi:hypothetical protein
MTAQIHDQCLVGGQRYDIAGIAGDELFAPGAHGLKPVPWSTGCWRGYVVTYALRNRRLVVRELAVNLSSPKREGVEKVPAPPLRDAEARRPAGPYGFEYLYEDMALPVAYTGGLLLARGFIEDLYVHMGFHPAWKYEEVLELIFEEGRLEEAYDVSDRIREMRAEMMLSPLDWSEGPVLDWIESTFQLDYGW